MEAYLGEIMVFGGNFAPRDWAFCDGQLLSISQNPGLYSLLGTAYGGDGKTTFALPDLQASVPLGQGQLPAGGTYDIGDSGGAASVTLESAQVGSHQHALAGDQDTGASPDPSGRTVSVGTNMYVQNAEGTRTLAPEAVAPVGNDAPHNNLQPYVVVNYVICLNGEYPHRP